MEYYCISERRGRTEHRWSGVEELEEEEEEKMNVSMDQTPTKRTAPRKRGRGEDDSADECSVGKVSQWNNGVNVEEEDHEHRKHP